MLSLLKGALFGIILFMFIVTIVRGLWWLFPSALLIGWGFNQIAKAMFSKDDRLQRNDTDK